MVTGTENEPLWSVLQRCGNFPLNLGHAIDSSALRCHGVSSATPWLFVRVAKPPSSAGICLSVSSPQQKETLLYSSLVHLCSSNGGLCGSKIGKKNLPGANVEITEKSRCRASQTAAETLSGDCVILCFMVFFFSVFMQAVCHPQRRAPCTPKIKTNTCFCCDLYNCGK